MRKLLFSFAVIALAVASAKTYTMNLFEPASVGGTELTPGEYKVELVDNNKAVIRNGKIDAQAPVKVETNDRKYDNTTVRFTNADGKMKIQEIKLGGTKTKLVFSE
jgi:hypothetical protein